MYLSYHLHDVYGVINIYFTLLKNWMFGYSWFILNEYITRQKCNFHSKNNLFQKLSRSAISSYTSSHWKLNPWENIV